MSDEPIGYATVHRPGGIGREIFGVVVRSFGLLLLLWGLYCLGFAAVSFGAHLVQSEYSNIAFLTFGVLYVGVGLALLKGEWLVRFAYDVRKSDHAPL
jgi:hypothetical protein